MSANTLDTTKYNTVAANTVFDAVLDATAILAWRDNVKTVVNQHAGEIDLKANKIQGAWIAPTLLNSWVNFGGATAPVGYYKDDLGIVRLRGAIKSGTITAGTAILTLPAGYRPLFSQSFVVDTNGGAGTMAINALGNLQIDTGINNVVTWLDSILFRAEQ